MIYNTIAVLSVLAGSAMGERLFNNDPIFQKYMFDNFKAEYDRSYSTMSEETSRFSNFVTNLKLIDERNDAEIKNGGSAIHGITKFSDLSVDEFKARYLTADASQKLGDAIVAEVPPYTGTASLVDWSGKYTTPVKDQGMSELMY